MTERESDKVVTQALTEMWAKLRETEPQCPICSQRMRVSDVNMDPNSVRVAYRDGPHYLAREYRVVRSIGGEELRLMSPY